MTHDKNESLSKRGKVVTHLQNDITSISYMTASYSVMLTLLTFMEEDSRV